LMLLSGKKTCRIAYHPWNSSEIRRLMDVESLNTGMLQAGLGGGPLYP
jgi:hypothetical protein